MDSVQPLRIAKTTPSTSPNKMATSRPLAEIGSQSHRRNSPSYNQATKKMIVSRESSPYTCTETSSPFSAKTTPREVWSGRSKMSPSRFDENTPDRSPSPSLSSPKRRSSIERLKQASRVKNSNIFALESKDSYDPSTLPIVERPTANRPLSQQLANNSFTRYDSLRKENNPLRSPQRPGHKRSETEIHVPLVSPSKVALPASPEKQDSPSPAKSAIARSSMFGVSPPAFDPENGTWSDDERVPTPRALHRHNKSVTFHHDPPVVNEYEQQTPEPSVSVGSREGSWDSDDYEDQDISFDRGSSAEVPDREDSFDEDLENTDKTPVVLPDDWTRMSPETAHTELVNPEDDVFESSPSQKRPVLGRSESVTSDGESRPLPPLPSFMAEHKRRDSGSLVAATERASHSQRNLPSPPKRASCSKDDILKMTRQSSLTLQDRLELIGNNSHHEKEERAEPHVAEDSAHGVPEELTVTNLDTGEKIDVLIRVAEAPVVEEEESIVADLADFSNAPAPHISRESILRKVRGTKFDYEDEDEDAEESVLDNATYADLVNIDPDQPIPSREHSREMSAQHVDRETSIYADAAEEQVFIKEEPVDDDQVDFASVPEKQMQPPLSPNRFEDYERQSSVLRYDLRSHSAEEDDDQSRYSNSLEPEAEGTVLHDQAQEADDGKESLQDAMQLLTVKDYSTTKEPAKKTSGDFMGLPAYLSADDYDFGMKQYITPSPPASAEDTSKQLSFETAPVLQPSAPLAQVSPPGTPESVVHQRDSDVSTLSQAMQAVPEPVVPDIPERRSTIKTGGRLKARPSATAADFEAIAEQRRIISSEHPVPAIPNAYRSEYAETASVTSSEGKVDSHHEQERSLVHRESTKSMKLDLSIPSLEAGDTESLALGLDAEFDRVIENQKKGYLMRQNTKVVVASNRNFSGDSNDTAKSVDGSVPTSEVRQRGTRSAGNSPRKPSAEQFLKTEPWNGKVRRKSVRNASAQRARNEPAPPLPGQESALGVVDEDFAAGTSNLEDEVGEGVERGRLFVKVVGVKELQLPMPKNDRIYFQLTLDNGLHCVTTTALELGTSAPIGQEFELVVLNDLDFQLTLSTKLPPRAATPPAPTPTPSSPTKSVKSQKTGSAFSRFLSSPKKRAERERLEREAHELETRQAAEASAQRKRATMAPPSVWDTLHDLVNASDGSFARAYINLASHQDLCFGRALTVDVPCYNEWALEKDSVVVNSVRSKRGGMGPVRKPPYVVGKLELQLLYVPKPRGAGDEEMPKSLSAAVREMGKARESAREEGEGVFEGVLSQQGGDCTHWRRRFFRLASGKLTAYHEHTHQKRAVINLAKASRLVDDKSTLVADPNHHSSSSSNKNRRKSAFAEEDEGYAYVEEGFRIRFANGETIDFYADSKGEKDSWMAVLSKVIGKPAVGGAGDPKKGRWTELVLAREKAMLKVGGPEETGSSSPVKQVSKSAGNSPVKPAHRASMQAAVGERPTTPPMRKREGHRTREAVKSAIY